MAYSSTVTITRKGNMYRVVIDETDTENTSEATIDLGLQIGHVVAAAWDFTSGSAITNSALLGTVTNPNEGTGLVLRGDRTAKLNENRASGTGGSGDCEGQLPAPFYSADGKLYHRSVPASGTDNVFKTEYLIKAGW